LSYLKLIRPLNLLFIAITQCSIKYGLFETMDVNVALSNFQFGLLLFATICVAAGGNVINDIFDRSIDKINKPNRQIIGKKIGEKAGYNYYIILNVLGVGAGFYLANTLGKPGLAAVFIVVSALLYLYSSQFKGLLVAGNLLVSVLVAFSLLILILFDIYPAINTDEMAQQVAASKVILLYSLAAFFLNFIREIVKDIQDINGDKNGDLRTLPIVLGRERAKNIAFALGVIALVAILYFMYATLYNFKTALYYFFFALAAPLLFFCIKTWNAETEKDYGVLSLILKIIMGLGVISILFFPSEIFIS